MELVQTCSSCPEQYDVFDGEICVGYLRARNGFFSAQFVPTGNYVYESTIYVYESTIEGDGSFIDSERDFHLANALEAIKEKIIQSKNQSDTGSARLQEVLRWSSSY